MASPFASPQEFHDVMDRIFQIMSEDPEIGPRLCAADVPRRFEFEDVDLVLNVRAGRPDEQANLSWAWGDEVDWSPKVRMTMSSETANRFFQGRESFVYAVARRRIKTSGDLKAALEMVPITKPIYERYRSLVAAEYPHLQA
ncbi:MAG TPA: hypothetical protein VK655_10970 [Solirubrobacteraceae bacterium]|jgi:hypothetical protein|nr:hypothetical protein [Solirubrobacteraceae bacterium]